MKYEEGMVIHLENKLDENGTFICKKFDYVSAHLKNTV